MFNIDLGVDASYLASLCFGMLSSWFAIITAAFLADIVSSALLNGKKFNLLISFILFLALSYLMGKVSGAISGEVITQTQQVMNSYIDKAGQTVEQYWEVTTVAPNYFLRHGLISLAFAALFYVGASELMQRKLSV